jgi:hypothetical protein
MQPGPVGIVHRICEKGARKRLLFSGAEQMGIRK